MISQLAQFGARRGRFGILTGLLDTYVTVAMHPNYKCKDTTSFLMLQIQGLVACENLLRNRWRRVKYCK